MKLRKFKHKNAVSVLMLTLILTKLFGLIKIRTIAHLFGVSRELDIFWAAFTIPDTIFNVLIAGGFSAGIIPVFSDILSHRGDKALNNLFHALIWLTTYSLFGLSIVAFIFTPQLTQLMIGNSKLKELFGLSTVVSIQDMQEMIDLTRIMLLSPMILGISNISTAYLQIHKRFARIMLAPLLYNVGMIIAAIIFVQMGSGIYGLAWATVIGSFLHLSIQIGPVLHLIFGKDALFIRKYVQQNSLKQYLINIIKLATPRSLALFAEQINVIINTFISFTLSRGALSAYKYAYSLHLFPAQIVGNILSMIALPDLAKSFSDNNPQKLIKTFNKAFQTLMFFILPMIAIILVLRLPLVRLAYGVGQFNWRATVITSWCLFLLIFSVLGQSIAALTLRVFFAIHDTKTPLIVSLVTVLINIGVSYYAVNLLSHYFVVRPLIIELFATIRSLPLELQDSVALSEILHKIPLWLTTRDSSEASVGGLALGISIAFMFEGLSYLAILSRRIGILKDKQLKIDISKQIVAFITMTATMYFVYTGLNITLNTSKTVSILFITGFISLIGGITYIGMLKLLKSTDLEILANFMEKIPYIRKYSRLFKH